MALDPRSGLPLREMMDRLFSEAFVMPRERGVGSRAGEGREMAGAQTPPINIYETDSDLMVVLPLPGVSPNDIQVELLGTQLTVRTEARRDEPHPDAGRQGGAPGAGQPQQRHRWYLHEFQIGPYHRSVELPYAVDADRIQASYEHGLLSLRCARPEAKTPRRIPLRSETQG
jgi:HSP20 family protein